MVDVRVSAASGTSDEWAASGLILGVGQLAWETDTQIMRVGDGRNVEPNLQIVAQPIDPIPIDDGNPSGGAVWSSLHTNAQIQAALKNANAYTDSGIQGILNGTTPRIDVCFQNTDGSWPSRPSAYFIMALSTGGSTTPPTWLKTGIDLFFVRS